eukprot:CAMPEP_0203679146 /NCGR_PEP_ID=MMETSP0090-20130426/34580_1 /ASSEMBLY_ACC=CAM_ASM_001088 /TAXON_ID=426623 /ORGANISM="Chaetoceros affinis, Strain CCMP159" /LENGTH=56 /DNA_ID=CAMNT_0050546681 /DNA_START=140 /DNA_END=306 /DNA_ORIENTATION=-
MNSDDPGNDENCDHHLKDDIYLEDSQGSQGSSKTKGTENESCSICLDDYKVGDEVV